MRSNIFRKYKFVKQLAVSVFLILLFLLSLNWIFPYKIEENYSTEIYSSQGKLLNAYLSGDDKWRLKTNIEEVTPEMIKSILAKEDKWFYYHLGVNPLAVFRALWQNVTTGERVSGASTITMQLVRMQQPATRSYFNKFLEMIRAVQLELGYSKDDILAAYLSRLPYGGNVEGVKAASYLFFNRPPEKLSLSQCVCLAIIPNDPNSLRIDRHPDVLVNKRNFWLDNFLERNLFKDKSISDAKGEKITSARYEFPKEIPHLARILKNRYNGKIVKTGIDFRKQKIAETLLKKYVLRQKSKDISNGSLIVLNNKTGAIEVYCGSQDFNDNLSSGQVDGVYAIRSPGSALKPFLYARAFDKGIITPKRKLLDVPTDFAGYSPVNYENKFNGWITVRFALLNSLNIPAVRLLNRMGDQNFINSLERMGFSTITEKRNELGLSLILGGCGTSLFELVRAYSAFGNKGKMIEPFYKIGENSRVSEIFSAESSYLVFDILSSYERAGVNTQFNENSGLPLFAWKTGTSYGKRDAWAIGFNSNYTIGVWLGNFSGEGSPYLNGAEIAVPLLFEIFNFADYGNKSGIPEIPDGLDTRIVCSYSGEKPGEFCSSTESDYFIKNVTLNNVCKLEKEIYVDSTESVQYCTECLPESGYKKIVIKEYPPEIIQWKTRNGESVKSIPHEPTCPSVMGDGKLVINSPQEGYEYYIDKTKKQKILLEAIAEGGVTKIYWYLNGKHFANSTLSEKLFFEPTEDEYLIRCIDDRGRYDEIKIKINYY